MLSSTFVTICGLALAVLGIAISIYYGRRALSQGKRELRWSVEAIPLLSSDVESYRSVVRVMIGERKLNHPHVVRLRITNTGKLDVESTMFDQGRPLVFELTRQKFFHVVESGGPAIKATSHSIKVGPELLPSGESWMLSFINDGAADVHLAENHLANVKIRGDVPRSSAISQWNKISLYAALASSAAAILALILVEPLLADNHELLYSLQRDLPGMMMNSQPLLHTFLHKYYHAADAADPPYNALGARRPGTAAKYSNRKTQARTGRP